MLFSVPSTKNDADLWMYYLRRVNEKYPTWKPIKKMVVCSKHFQQKDFYIGASRKKFIIPGHYPSLDQNMDLNSDVLFATIH